MITSNESRLSTPTPQTGRNSLQPLDGDINSQDDRLIGKDGLTNQVDRLRRLSSDIHEGHKMDSKTGIQECAGCCKPISERYMLKALDLYWHEDCLKCGCCDCRLGEVGSTLYTKANLILCRRDYLRLFGSTGYCSACSKVIPAFEMVMRARTNVYHLECFACQQCNHRFCVGDRFYLCDNKILCEYDYEERLVFANMAYNPNQLAQLKRQANGQIPSPSLPAPVRSIGSGDLNNNMSQQQSALKAPSS